MKNRIVNFLVGVGAMLGGYHVIVALTILGFNGWLEGRNLYGGGGALLLKGTLVAVVAGLAGGMAAGLIGWRWPVVAASLVLLPLALDTTYVLFIAERSSPLWFEAMGSLALMLFTVGGGVIIGLLKSRLGREEKALSPA
ncbi:MAG: hypothetical protein KY459_00480 [Acidobacteria bacterium]|nr:hypothetical protein [Acidobacteriota bacterium]